MASRTQGTSPAETGVVLQAPTIGGSSSGGGGSQSQSSQQGILNPDAWAMLMDFMKQVAGGGTEEQRRQRAERQTEIQRTRALGGDFTKRLAFADAAELMAQNLRQSLEKNMPAISRSIQGAGTSASSMQGLLSQKLATESAQAASALGAEQAKSYGTISTQLQSILEALTRSDNSQSDSLLKALDLSRASMSSGSSTSNPTTQVGASGGGSFFQPVTNSVSAPVQALAPVAAYGAAPASVYPNGGYVVNTSSGAGSVFKNGQTEQFQYLPAADQQTEQSVLDQQYAQGWGYGD